jgi:hypothetical protein
LTAALVTSYCFAAFENNIIISHFWATAFLRRFCQSCLPPLESEHPVITLDFVSRFLKSKSGSLASNTQPGRPGPRIYIPQEVGGPVILPGTRFLLRTLLQLTGLRWRYSNPPPYEIFKITSNLKFLRSYIKT